MKHTAIISAALFVAAVLMMLLQLWFNLWSGAIFCKMMITAGALLAISLVISFVRKEIKDTHRLKNGGDLDK